LSDIEEFSDTPQSDLSENEITDILIFNVLEIIPSKINLSQSEKNIFSNKDKQDNSIQALFNYVVKKAEVPITSIFRISEISKTFKPFKLVIDKLKTNLNKNKPFKFSNKEASSIFSAK